MLRALHALSLVPVNPGDFSYRLLLVAAGGDEQLASQLGLQDGTVDKVVVEKHADVGKVVLNVPPRQRLTEASNRVVKPGSFIFFYFYFFFLNREILNQELLTIFNRRLK